jgi:hypothetical protein
MNAFGLQPGPIVGEMLERIREAQAIGEIQSAEEAVNLARRYLNHHN